MAWAGMTFAEFCRELQLDKEIKEDFRSWLGPYAGRRLSRETWTRTYERYVKDRSKNVHT